MESISNRAESIKDVFFINGLLDYNRMIDCVGINVFGF